MMKVRIAAAALATQIAAPSAVAQTTAEPFRVVALGTSLTRSGGWAEPLQEMLARCMGRPVEVVPVAQAGATSAWGLEQVRSIEERQPNAVLVEFAANDAALHRRIGFAASVENMRRIVRSLSHGASTPRVVVMSMNPVHGWRGWVRPRFEVLSAAHGRAAAAEGAAFLDLIPRWRALHGRGLGEAIPDGLHPTQKAAREVVVPVAASLLAGRSCGA